MVAVGSSVTGPKSTLSWSSHPNAGPGETNTIRRDNADPRGKVVDIW